MVYDLVSADLVWKVDGHGRPTGLLCGDLNLSLALDHPARNHHNRDRPNRIQKKMAISITRP